ncbi:lytic transglycosylase domain-containing protein [Helicobacter bizzozeronii]|uniref:lytic transglycosylase domain-containing protein n=1 Tax=Helicobacter bizzozeronii TaxID=56877 RepID=UPI000CF03BAC|nr:lytic transglycosylase domain-containing protein [Helicobacter bizzozeronii]
MRSIVKIALLASMFASTLLAQEITLDFLKSKPKGIARDFYIWMFLQEKSTTAEEAQEAYRLVNSKSARIQAAMVAKKAIPTQPGNVCYGLSLKELSLQNNKCIATGLTISRILKHTHNQTDRELLLFMQEKIAQTHPKLHAIMKVLLSLDKTQEVLKANASTLSSIYNALSYRQRLNLLDHAINPKTLAHLADQNDSAFNDILRRIVRDARFSHFKKSLARARITHSDSKTFFILGLNAAMHDERSLALEYFKRSEQEADGSFLKNRALFWQYLVSHNKTYLHTLSQSTSPDLFSIYANLNLGTTPKYKIVSALEGIRHKQPNFDIKDPFEWQILRDKILAIQDKNAFLKALEPLKTTQTTPHLAYFLDRYYNKQRHYFLAPYEGIISWKSVPEKALAYAVARQESLLLPALISRSYALGLMQIMPFNVAPFARQIGTGPTKLTDMFNPKIALVFGNYYLNYLKEEFKHPLFVAYSYNGGPKFFRHLLKERHFFTRQRKFEPWLSMELIPYSETRLYGQKVMANYIIYQKLFASKQGEPHHFDINAFFDATLKDTP